MSMNKLKTVGNFFTQTQLAALTDNSGGSAVDTIVVAGATYAAAEANANAASFAAKINQINVDVAAIMAALNEAN